MFHAWIWDSNCFNGVKEYNIEIEISTVNFRFERKIYLCCHFAVAFFRWVTLSRSEACTYYSRFFCNLDDHIFVESSNFHMYEICNTITLQQDIWCKHVPLPIALLQSIITFHRLPLVAINYLNSLCKEMENVKMKRASLSFTFICGESEKYLCRNAIYGSKRQKNELRTLIAKSDTFVSSSGILFRYFFVIKLHLIVKTAGR